MKPLPTSATLSLRIQPGAKREGVVGAYGDALKIAIAAPAVDGKANEALIRLLASLLGIVRARIEIVSGQTSRSKVVRIEGLSTQEVLRALTTVE
ncbi:hypothetical protein SAMN05421819_1721 [Bryocella elongata]|uniref:UPF0235 protein SAMN05421819_1721 n=1 Tax=Bryocella elongata TaxID=863522 RepID=A0A1H5WSU1_9BACT|nr:DUF167 domain-containing protein [Bryocella elongata]SEG02330.1 hypothetical protein SAMN05421819_1721 [Bryocella elongata]